MSRKIFFSIIIPVFNHKEILIDTLNSINDQSYLDFEVILINNGNDNLSFLKEKYHFNLTIYVCDCNRYYANAINKGYNLSKGEYLLFLNSDVSLEKNYLYKIFNTILTESHIDCIWGEILTLDNKCESIGIRDGLSLRPIDEKINPIKVIGPPGAVFAVSNNFCKLVLKTFGDIMDADISFFYSDLSFAKRIEYLKAKTFFIANMKAFHIRHGSIVLRKSIIPFSFFKFDLKYKLLLIENRSKYLQKWFYLKKNLLKLPFIISYSFIIRIVYFFSR